MKGILEGLLYVEGDQGLTIEEASNILEIPEEEAKELILSLKQDYIDNDRGLRINYLGNSYREVIVDYDDVASGNKVSVDNNIDGSACLSFKLDNGSLSEIQYFLDLFAGGAYFNGNIQGNAH